MPADLNLLRLRIHDGIQAALDRPLVRTVLSADALRLLRAMGAYWDRADDTALRALYELLPMFAQEKEATVAWKQGPLPPDTYGWGGVVPAGENTGGGFYFADFKGDHVLMIPGDRRLNPDQVGQYDNSLTLPPGVKGRCLKKS